MSMELESRFIRRGVWTNLDHGPIFGKTITTDTQTGNLIVALLAVLSTIGTAHLWHLVTFCVHQLRANGRPEDALFRQQQALLRTLPSPATVMADTIKLWWAWRSKARRPLLRSIVLIFVAVAFAAATGAASVFSSLVVDTTDLQVLVKSRGCGWVHFIRAFERGYRSPVKSASVPYARQCYVGASGDKDLPLACNVLVNRELLYNTSRVPCPFDADACEPGVDSVTFDTGLLDVGPSFGLNIASSDGVKFRQKMTCSVMYAGGVYQDMVRASLTSSGRVIANTSAAPVSMLFHYGSSVDSPIEGVTWAANRDAAMINMAYSVFAWYNHSSPRAPVQRGFEPRPEILRANHSVTMISVGLNDHTYFSPTYDPLFRATDAVEYPLLVSTGEIKNTTRYAHNIYARALGCQEQYQFCHKLPSGEDFCTEPGELPLNVWLGNLPPSPYIDTSMFPEANDIQQTILRLLSTSAWMFNMGTVAEDLLAGSVDNPDSMKGFPDNQWILEVERWQKQILASIQVAFTDFSIGPGERDTAFPVHMRINTTSERQLCGMQKMKKTGDVVNINVFGLSFIVAFSCLVAILDWTILKFLIFLSRFRRALAPRIDRWIQDGVWQLQRRAYEGEGYRQWTNLEADVPLTQAGQTLKDLPILWVPEKTPTDSSSEAYTLVGSFGSQHPSSKRPTVQDEEMAETGSQDRKGRAWLGMFRR